MREQSALDAAQSAGEVAAEAIIEVVREFLNGELWKLWARGEEFREQFREHRRHRDRELDALDRKLKALRQTLNQVPASQGAEVQREKRRSLQREGGRHPKPIGQVLRIGMAVEMVATATFLKPTRRDPSKRGWKNHSACSIVQVALERLGEHIPERTIEGIWRRYQKLPKPPHLRP